MWHYTLTRSLNYAKVEYLQVQHLIVCIHLQLDYVGCQCIVTVRRALLIVT